MQGLVKRSRLGFLVLAITQGPAQAQLVINEVMADNASTIEDPDEPGRFEDWLELYNAGPADLDLSGMYLTDDLSEPTRWQVPSGVGIGSGEYLIFWTDDDNEQGDTHTNFNLRAAGEVIGLYDTDGRTLVDSVRLDQQEADISFGRSPDGAERWCFMGDPSPGAPNEICRSGSPEFSRLGGTFATAFSLELMLDAPVGEIYYTLDGDEPDEQSGSRYSGPIMISETTWVRARAYEPGLLPGPIVSQVYLGLDSNVEEFHSNLPIVVVDTFGHNIDGETGASRPWRPVMAVFIDTDEENGRAAITDEPDFAGYGGMHVRGASSTQYPKKSYAMETWDESGNDRNVSILGFPLESDWILHGPYSDKTLMRNHLMYTWSRRIGRYAVRTRFVEAYVNRRGGRVAERDYVGVYVFMERIKRDRNRVNIAALAPSDSTEPEITGGYLLKRDWLEGGSTFFTTSTYRDALIYVEPSPEEVTAEQRAWIKSYIDEFEEVLSGPNFADPIDGYARYIDANSFVDHHILVEMARNVDGFVLSTFLYKDRGGKLFMGPIWDYNGSLGGANYFCTCQTEGWHHEFDERTCGECAEGSATFPADNPNGFRWYARLQQDPVFWRRYAARWFQLRQDLLSTDRLLNDIDDVVALLTDDGAPNNPVERNFARWNILNSYVWPNFFVRGTYEEHVNWMKTWLSGRLEWMDSALIVPPELDPPGGPVSAGVEVTMHAPHGEIHYTVNGPDPRGADGNPSPESVLYVGPVAIIENTRIRARTRLSSGIWSSMAEAAYVTERMPLVVTEIMYDPPRFPEDTHDFTTDYEFLEFANVGQESLDLAGVRVMRESGGILRTRFDFAQNGFTALAPNECVVIVRSVDAFRSRYGDEATVAGQYTGSLNNGGDTIIVLGALDEPIAHFAYESSWYPSTNGEGHSLVLRDPNLPVEAWSDAESWRPSAVIGGSPCRPDVPPEEGLQLPGDYTQDNHLNLTDAVAVLNHLFLGVSTLPCETDDGNRQILDVNRDQALNLADAVYTLVYLFGGGPAPVLGTHCVTIPGCPNSCLPE